MRDAFTAAAPGIRAAAREGACAGTARLPSSAGEETRERWDNPVMVVGLSGDAS